MKQSSSRQSKDARSDYSRGNAQVYHKKLILRRRKNRLVKGILGTGGLAVVLVLGIFSVWVFGIQSKLGANITDSLRALLAQAQSPKGPFYVLMLGTDGRPGETSFRSDTIVLTRIDPAKKKVTLLSIPRDTRVKYKGNFIKINAAHAIDGPEGMVRAVNKLCHVKISHYVEASFTGFSSLVDSLGGVEVNVPDRIDDWKAGNSIIEKGEQKLNGAQALTFVRSRRFADGDYSRMRHQRIFLTALIKKVLSTRDPGTLIKTINSVSNMVSTDLSVPDIISIANSLRGMNVQKDLYSANIPSYTKNINGISFVIAKEDEVISLMKHIDKGQDPRAYLSNPNTVSESDSHPYRDSEES